MAWTIKFSRKAEKQLSKLEIREAKRIRRFLQERVAPLENPRILGKPLRGLQKGAWRYRVGDYRLICHFENDILVVLVLEIGHRREVYRR